MPLLLTLLCLTFERRGEFPPDRDEIYRWAVNALLFEWDNSRLIKRDALYKGLDVKYKERLLAWVAAQTFDRGEYLLEEARLADLIAQYLATVPGLATPLDGLGVLKAIEAHHGLLVERAQGIYSFSHLTLQEYFTARYIVDNAAAGTLPRLMQHVGEDRWREVFLLTAGMLYDAQAFASAYLAALAQMAAQDKTVTEMLQWGVQQSAQSRGGVKPPALRALLIYLARALTLALAAAYDWLLLNDLPDETAGIVPHVQQWSQQATIPDWLRTALAGLSVPSAAADAAAWQAFHEQVEAILLRHWVLTQFWELSPKQADLLARYLAANQLLLECLAVASVPNREAIEAQMLLPSQQATENKKQKTDSGKQATENR